MSAADAHMEEPKAEASVASAPDAAEVAKAVASKDAPAVAPEAAAESKAEVCKDAPATGPEAEQDAKAPDREGANRDTRPAWMTKGIGVGTKMLGEATGDLVKPGMTKAQFEELQKAGVSDGPDPFGDVFREKKPVASEPAADRSMEELGWKEDVEPSKVSAQQSEATPAQIPSAPLGPAVYIAGRKFHTRAEVIEHVKKIQDSHASDDGSAGHLSMEDSLFIFHLMLHHPKAVDKMNIPVAKFRYGIYDTFKNKCFISVRSDGSQEGVSSSKSIDAIFPRKGVASPVVAGAAGLVVAGGATGSTSTVEATAEEERGTKRAREPEKYEEERVFVPHKIVKDSVLDIKGVSRQTTYHWLKEHLQETFGAVRYVEFLKPPSKDAAEPSAKRPCKEAVASKDSTEVSQDKAVGGSANAENDATKVDNTTVDGASNGEPPEATVEPEAAGEATTMDDKDESSSDGDKDEFVTARCRFNDAECAKKAAEELTEVDGSKVEVTMLSGADEEAFWEATNKKLKDMFDNPNPKGKGKKGKGKGKGKSKGKGKGKGYSKGW